MRIRAGGSRLKRHGSCQRTRHRHVHHHLRTFNYVLLCFHDLRGSRCSAAYLHRASWQPGRCTLFTMFHLWGDRICFRTSGLDSVCAQRPGQARQQSDSSANGQQLVVQNSQIPARTPRTNAQEPEKDSVIFVSLPAVAHYPAISRNRVLV